MYDKCLQHNELDIWFTFELADDQDGLLLCGWSAYDQNNVEVQIPCKVEIDFIEKMIWEKLEDIWSYDGYNYIQDYREYLGDKMHDYYTDR